jgi:hypothetical protein
MILYTFQPDFRWQELIEKGYIVSDTDNILDEHFLDSYSWLEERMKNLLPSPEIECLHPMWAWYRYNNKSRPTLRGQFNKNEVGYLIKFQIDDDKVLLSDFDKWHLILNASEKELNQKKTIFDLKDFDQDDISNLIGEGFEIEEDKITYNWNNILLNKESTIGTIQATFWCLKKEQIISYKKIKGR